MRVEFYGRVARAPDVRFRAKMAVYAWKSDESDSTEAYAATNRSYVMPLHHDIVQPRCRCVTTSQTVVFGAHAKMSISDRFRVP